MAADRSGKLSTISERRRIACGDLDEQKEKVYRIFASTDHYILYLAGSDRYSRVRYVLPDSYEDAKYLRTKLAPLTGEIATISNILAGFCTTSLGVFPRGRALSNRTLDRVARAMQMALEGNERGAMSTLAAVQSEIAACRDSRNKMRYIAANTMALTVLFTLWWRVDWSAVGLGWVSESRPLGPGAGNQAYRFIDVLMLGAFGAFFVVSATLERIKVNHSITLLEMVYAGFVRILIGMIAAGVVLLLIAGGWILASIDRDFLLPSLYLVAFVAGFSEYFVPNALRQVENRSRVQPRPSGETVVRREVEDGGR